MKLPPLQADFTHRPGRASELVAAVLPAGRSRPAASVRQRPQPSQPPARAAKPVQGERLLDAGVRREAAARRIQAEGLRAHRALRAYGQVADAGQGEVLSRLMGISLYA